MRHTVHLVLGDELQKVGSALKRYSLKYGEGLAKEYYQVYCLSKNDNNIEIFSFEKASCSNLVFTSDIEDDFAVNSSKPKVLNTDFEIQSFFEWLYGTTVTVDNPGELPVLNLCVYLPLSRKDLWQEIQKIIVNIKKLDHRFNIDILGLAPDLSFLYYENTSENHFNPDNIEIMKSIVDEIIDFKEKGIHRLLMIQHQNVVGLSLGLNFESFISILGEYALASVEHYSLLFPQSTDNEKSDITTFGLSVMSLDKYYFVQYLLRRAFLHVIEKEGVTQEGVDVNKVAPIAHECLRNRTQLLDNFYNSEIKPLLEQELKHEKILQKVTPLLNEKIDELIGNFQTFIEDENLSLPEKQVIMALLMGYDDELFKGYLFNPNQLTIHDCDRDALNLFISEHNKYFVGKENVADSEDKEDNTDEPLILDSPKNSEGEVFLPINELKKIRNEIVGATNYIRNKTRELEDQYGQIQRVSDAKKRLTEEGFVFGDVVYSLQSDYEIQLFEETYEPNKAIIKKDVDMRKMFGPIKDQKTLGACSAFAITSIFEYFLYKKNNNLTSLSERFLYYNSLYNDGEVKDNGISLFNAIKSASEKGISKEEYCLYNVNQFNEKPSEEAYTDAQQRVVTKAMNVKLEHQHIVSALSEGYPVAVSLKIYNSFADGFGGFVYKPTEEDYSDGKCGNHAMVICGYSEEDKVYIVRNSWGRNFGDKGYCYIPFSYIEDSNLCNHACIIVKINEAELKGLNSDAFVTVSFSRTDADITYSIIRVLIDEKKHYLSIKENEYKVLKKEYETLVQSLADNSVRKSIADCSDVTSQKEHEINEHIKSATTIQREKELEQHEDNTKRSVIIFGLVLVSFIAILGLSIDYTSISTIIKSFQKEITWICLGGILLDIVAAIAYWKVRKHQWKKTDLDYRENIAQLSVISNEIVKEQELKPLKFHVAGMIIDRLSKMRNSMDMKYSVMKSYVGNLKVWQREEQQKLNEIIRLDTSTFVPLLSDNVLNKFFEDKKDEITQDIHLYEFFIGNGMILNEQAIINFKNTFKQTVIDRLYYQLTDFSMYDYLVENSTNYPYLDSNAKGIDKVLPLMDERSQCFLHIKESVTNIHTSPIKLLLINTTGEEEKRLWETTYTQFFQERPLSESTSSNFKIQMIQVFNIKKEQACILK